MPKPRSSRRNSITQPVLVLSLLGLAACGASSTNENGGTMRITASGEILALNGYAYPPAQPDAPTFVDGWEVRFDTLLVTLDKFVVAENPDKSPNDQSLTANLHHTRDIFQLIS